MFIVLEMQKLDKDTLAILPANTYESQAEADSKYHAILSVAAISSVWKHSAVMLDENGTPLKYDCYIHLPESAE